MSAEEVVFRVDTEHSPTKYQAFAGWQIVVMSVILLGIGIYAYKKQSVGFLEIKYLQKNI